jgi:hypothetical protein
MFVNVLGRVKNTSLPKTQGLLPLLETIMNSIDAIEDAHDDISHGTIEITILKPPAMDLATKPGEPQFRRPIYGFQVVDNGIGFTDDNWQAFNEADTRYKQDRGGKGIGRFIWLKAFKQAEVERVFEEDGQLKRRVFTFSVAEKDGISDYSLTDAPSGIAPCTTVRLMGFDPAYEERVPRSLQGIAQRIIEHFLAQFILTRMPVVILTQGGEHPIRLDVLYDKLVSEHQPETIDIQGHSFDIVHFMLQAHADIKHQICYCANRRVVEMVKISGRIPNLGATLTGPDGEEFVYAVYVSSDYLDRRVNSERLGFDSFSEDALTGPGEIARSTIEEAIIKASRAVLAPYTDVVRQNKEERIQRYTVDYPEFRHIVKNHSEYLDAIPPDVTDEKLDEQLHDINRKIEKELRNKGEELLEAGVLADNSIPYEKQLENFREWWEEYNEEGKSTLAKYIVHRKLILCMLEKALQIQDTGKYSREEIIHQMIFPLKKTSDDVTYDQHNLWVIDEKLAYHYYLASDLPLQKVEVLESESLIRPDLLFFFDNAIAVVDGEPPYNSGVVVIEFKRPMRADYPENDNPIIQVQQYVKEIKSGLAQTKDGRPFQSTSATPFYCYVICDLTHKVRDQAEIAGLTPTPDNMGYIWYNSALGAYLEVISFEKLLSDASKRNRVLFDKLSLPAKLPSK